MEKKGGGSKVKEKKLEIPEVMIFEPTVHDDSRGFFFESYNKKIFNKLLGENITFLQDNHSKSSRGVLRGLHYQKKPFEQGKLVRVVFGEVFDVAVDIRKESKTFGEWVGEYLSADNKKQIWIPPGFAHGFVVISEEAQLLYKTTNYYSQDHEACILFSDKDIDIKWPISNPMLSEKDLLGKKLSDLI